MKKEKKHPVEGVHVAQVCIQPWKVTNLLIY